MENNLIVTEDGIALACALKAGLIQKRNGAYDKEQISQFLWAFSASQKGPLRINGEQWEVLNSNSQCTYRTPANAQEDVVLVSRYKSSYMPSKNSCEKCKDADDERCSRYISVGSLILCLVCLAATIIFKFF